MTNMIMSGQFTSLLFSLACVFIILAIAFKSVRAGVIGSIPLVLTIMLNYMVMGFAGINLDMFTSLIASLAVGIGIDYTIHFMTDYRENRITCGSPEEATRATFRKSGRGIVTNALSVGLGFIVLCFSNFVVLGYIGILVAAVMFTSSVLAMTIVPAILNTTDPEFLRRA
jgi:predicted RND superfamily exporter protein